MKTDRRRGGYFFLRPGWAVGAGWALVAGSNLPPFFGS
jgi:hypothetical protein